MTRRLETLFQAQAEAHRRFAEESPACLLEIVQAFVDCLNSGGKILLCGNGGSAADAQHVAAELVGRFTRERAAWPAIALTTDTSIITAIGNDYGFDQIFARQVTALADVGDVVVGISTSGKSPNVLEAITVANEIGAKTIGFTNQHEGELNVLCELTFNAPSDVTARVQEIHLQAWHIICDLVEEEMINGQLV